MSRRADKQAGVTLVELTVGLGILGIIAVIGSEMLTRFQEQSAKANARSESERTASLLVSTVRKDVMRLPTAQRAALPATCAGFNCVMVLPNGQRVQYQTACVSNPHASRFTIENTATGFCLPPCQPGSFPQITVTRIGGDNPGVTTFGKRTGTNDMLGAGLCLSITGAGAAQTATLDIVVLAPTSPKTASVYRTRETMTFGNAAGVDVRRRR